MDVDSPDDFDQLLLVHLDSTLRCPICGELFSGPVLVTSCSHSFCSKCLRESLDVMDSRPHCPTCFVETDQGKIRKNINLEEVVRAWICARPLLLEIQYSTRHESKSSSKKSEAKPSRSTATHDANALAGPSHLSEKSSGRNIKSKADTTERRGGKKEEEAEAFVEDEIDSSDMEIIEEEKFDKDADLTDRKLTLGRTKSRFSPRANLLVRCPMCSCQLRNVEVIRHMSRCNPRSDTNTTHDETQGAKGNGAIVGSKSEEVKAWGKLLSNKATGDTANASKGKHLAGSKLDEAVDQSIQTDSTIPLPLTSYSGMKLAQLKRLLEDSNLPINISPSAVSANPESTAAGLKSLIYKRRHRHWTTIWNANLDLSPEDSRRKSKAQLVTELERWEKVQDSPGNEKATVGDKKGWQREHEAQFRDLVRIAKEGELANRLKGQAGKATDLHAVSENEGSGIAGIDAKLISPRISSKGFNSTLSSDTIPEPNTEPCAAAKTEEDFKELIPGSQSSRVSSPAFTEQDGHASFSPSPTPPASLLSSTVNPRLMSSLPRSRDTVFGSSGPMAKRRMRSLSPFDPEGPKPSQRARALYN